jgi:hypothetical protein
MTMIEQYTIGSDPEGFLLSKETGKHVPAIGLIGGDKRQPKPIGNGFAVLEDNVMVEYNIPPSLMGEQLSEHIKHANSYIEKEILKDRFSIDYVPSVKFESEDLDNPKAMEFGCEPDFCVWTEMERVLDTDKTNIRFAGGHLHFGYDKPNIDSTVKLVKIFDLFLGVPSVLLDSDQLRREIYGQAGSFRFKDYGLEYRTLSNFWVNKHEELIRSLINDGINFYNNDSELPDQETIVETINNGDQDKAKKLISKYNIKL